MSNIASAFGVIAFSILMLPIFIAALAKRIPVRDGIVYLTTLGIFGTFLGITFGLYNFDPSDVGKSVPILLTGLKLAFVSSLVGMFLSMLLRYLSSRSARATTQAGVTASDLVQLISEADHIAREDRGKTLAALGGIEKSLIGDGDTTLITQLRLMRQESKDQGGELLGAFKDFARDMAENNSKALISALEQVIRDFNLKLTEQFGENFKELNHAVHKLVEWQEQYRQQIAQSIELLQTASASTNQINLALGEIAVKADAINHAMLRLEQILKSYDASQRLLEQKLAAFAGLAEQASAAFPVVKEGLDSLVEDVHKSAESSRGVLALAEKTITEMEKKTSASLTATTEEMKKLLVGIGRDLKTLADENRKNILNQIDRLDEALGEELTKSLRSLGDQMATLSRKFVDDYGPLTDKLARVVRMAEATR